MQSFTVKMLILWIVLIYQCPPGLNQKADQVAAEHRSDPLKNLPRNPRIFILPGNVYVNSTQWSPYQDFQRAWKDFNNWKMKIFNQARDWFQSVFTMDDTKDKKEPCLPDLSLPNDSDQVVNHEESNVLEEENEPNNPKSTRKSTKSKAQFEKTKNQSTTISKPVKSVASESISSESASKLGLIEAGGKDMSSSIVPVLFQQEMTSISSTKESIGVTSARVSTPSSSVSTRVPLSSSTIQSKTGTNLNLLSSESSGIFSTESSASSVSLESGSILESSNVETKPKLPLSPTLSSATSPASMSAQTESSGPLISSSSTRSPAPEVAQSASVSSVTLIASDFPSSGLMIENGSVETSTLTSILTKPTPNTSSIPIGPQVVQTLPQRESSSIPSSSTSMELLESNEASTLPSAPTKEVSAQIGGSLNASRDAIAIGSNGSIAASISGSDSGQASLSSSSQPAKSSSASSPSISKSFSSSSNISSTLGTSS